MEVTGIVFICVIFAISIALVGFCCLKFCTSEDKYEINPGNGNSLILPTSTTNSTVPENHSMYFSAIPPHPSKSSLLDVVTNQIMQRNKPYPKSGYNLSSLPKPGFIIDATQAAPYTSVMLPYPPKPPPIGFQYPPDTINTDTARPQCPYPVAQVTKFRTPSPTPATYKTEYSPRTSSYFSEYAGPFTGSSFPSAENLNNPSKPQPPSYAEAMRKHQLPTLANSPKTESSECKPYR